MGQGDKNIHNIKGCLLASAVRMLSRLRGWGTDALSTNRSVWKWSSVHGNKADTVECNSIYLRSVNNSIK